MVLRTTATGRAKCNSCRRKIQKGETCFQYPHFPQGYYFVCFDCTLKDMFDIQDKKARENIMTILALAGEK